MDPESLHRRLRLISLLGVVISASGLILIILQEHIILGIILLVPGMIMVSTFKTATVLKLTYEMKKDKN